MAAFRIVSCAVSAVVAGLALAPLPGCLSVTSTVVSMAGTAAHQERGLDGRLSDLGVSTAIRGALYDTNHEYAADVGVTVYDGHVVLTGVVRSAEERAVVDRIAHETAGVVAVTNEIIVTDPLQVDTLRDGMISAKLEARLLVDYDVDAVNFSVSTVNRTVYLMGVARNRDELHRVVAHARDLEHVRHVVSHVQLKDERDAAVARVGDP